MGDETSAGNETFYSEQFVTNLIEVNNGETSYEIHANGSNTFDVKDNGQVIGTIEAFSSDSTNLPLNSGVLEPTDNVTEDSSASVIFKLKQGNTVVETVSVPVVFDETAPTAPTVTGQSPAFNDDVLNSDEAGNDQVVRVSFTDAEIGDLLELSAADNDGDTIETVLTEDDISNGYVDVTIPADTYDNNDDDNTVNIDATLYDQANNSVSASNTYDVGIDLTGAAKSRIETNADTTGNDDTAYEAGETITIKFDSKVEASNISIDDLGLNNGDWDTSTVAADDEDTNGYATSFTVTLADDGDGSNGTLNIPASGDTITIDASKVVDEAGNEASGSITFDIADISGS
ncbi:hypothetical protein [Lentibacillus cibarius]|uniref:Bacterial Ig-like domain-containing protein n=1 Tax=Lentibacillus cibarius TaxID=2583219 RepID=A0A5S3QJB8_9BACI|nr:hypothetical protein [Lentibacillus cibarius]TMN21819.1 hypothetical protein FFL34_06615 [Lentibacillus cibarius]